MRISDAGECACSVAVIRMDCMVQGQTFFVGWNSSASRSSMLHYWMRMRLK